MSGARATTWEGRSVDEWRERWGLPALHVFDRTHSTNDVARRLAEQGAPAGTTVLAEHQTGGRGRRGRSWTAPPGSSLLLSMLLRPRHGASHAVLSLRLGLAAARAIESLLPVHVALKWPNDLFVSGRKVGGILCEGALEGDRPVYLIAGIGLNVTQHDDDWPPELARLATSLEAATHQPVPRDRLAGRLLAEWLAVAGDDAATIPPGELDQFRRHDHLRGQPVAVDGRFAGIAHGITPDGALRVQHLDRTRTVRSGTVRLHHPQGDPS